MGRQPGAWCRVNAALLHHRKVRALSRELGGIERAWSLPVALWLYAIENQFDDGVLRRVSLLEIAEVCQWRGDPEALVRALVVSGWLDEDATGTLRIHDWQEYARRFGGASDADRKKDEARERMRTLRALEKLGRPGTPGQEGTPSNAGTPATSDQQPEESEHRSREQDTVRAPVRSEQEGEQPRAPARRFVSSSSRVVEKGSGEKVNAGPDPGDADGELALLGAFASWWLAYPVTPERPSSRVRAWEAWRAAAEALPPIDSMLRRLERQKASSGWRVNGGQYIPKAENYLRDARWLDVDDPGESEAPVGAEEGSGWDQEVVVRARLLALAERIPIEQRDQFGARVMQLEQRADLVEIEEQLSEIQRDLEAAIELSLSEVEAEELARQVRVGLARFEQTLPNGALNDLRRRFRQQGLRRLRAVPLLSLFAPEAIREEGGAAEEDAA